MCAYSRMDFWDSSGEETCSSMKESIQKLIQEFKAVIFHGDELEFQAICKVKALSPFRAFQDCI